MAEFTLVAETGRPVGSRPARRLRGEGRIPAVVYGNGVEKYVLSDGRPYEMHTRWTATMAKEDDGHWRVRAIHIATNFLDNPILTQAEHALEKVGAIAGAIGLVLGALLGWFFGRKKKL